MPGMPRPVADEREGLLAFLAQQRYFVRVATHGLTDEQARATPSVSQLSIGGLIKHLARTERNWMDDVLQRSPRPDNEASAAAYVDSFTLRPDETLADALHEYDQVAKETESIVAGIADLGQPVPVPPGVPWFPPDVSAWSVRWVLLHLIEETARHAGHADIIRESLDGAKAVQLLAAVEGWEPTRGRSRGSRPARPTARLGGRASPCRRFRRPRARARPLTGPRSSRRPRGVRPGQCGDRRRRRAASR
jgi:Protein of unknown function (DUF664)